MKSIANLLLLTVTVLTATVALADSPAIHRVLLDDHTVVSVPLATNRGNSNWLMSKARRFFPCAPSLAGPPAT